MPKRRTPTLWTGIDRMELKIKNCFCGSAKGHTGEEAIGNHSGDESKCGELKITTISEFKLLPKPLGIKVSRLAARIQWAATSGVADKPAISLTLQGPVEANIYHPSSWFARWIRQPALRRCTATAPTTESHCGLWVVLRKRCSRKGAPRAWIGCAARGGRRTSIDLAAGIRCGRRPFQKRFFRAREETRSVCPWSCTPAADMRRKHHWEAPPTRVHYSTLPASASFC